MYDRILKQMREKIRTRQYVMTISLANSIPLEGSGGRLRAILKSWFTSYR
jgi:hypothetical protein